MSYRDNLYRHLLNKEIEKIENRKFTDLTYREVLIAQITASDLQNKAFLQADSIYDFKRDSILESALPKDTSTTYRANYEERIYAEKMEDYERKKNQLERIVLIIH